MIQFKSDRERQLWIWVGVTLVGIFTTLGLAGTLAEELLERELAEVVWIWGLVITAVAVAGIGFARRRRWTDFWIAIGVVAVLAMALPRAGFDAAERSHLFEYGLVASLVYRALEARFTEHPRPVATPLFAVAITSGVGALDEIVQQLFPNRGFELVDIGFNSFAAAVVVGATWSVSRVWGRLRSGRS